MHRSTRTVAPRWLAAAIAAALWAGCAAAPPPPPPAPVPVAAVDLSRIGRLGVVHFNSDGETALEPLARREFHAAVRSLQPSASLVELGAAAGLLKAVGRKSIDAATIRAIGQKHGVDAVLVGELWADTIDPVEYMQRARSAPNTVELEGTLSAQIFEARQGTKIWSTSTLGRKHDVDAVLVGELWADTIDPVEYMQRARSAPSTVELEGSLNARIFETRQGAAIWSASALGKKPINPARVDAWGSKSVDLSHLEKARAALVQDLVAQATADFRPTLSAPLAGKAPVPRSVSQPAPAKAAHGD